jgi:hypothetical protein
MRHRNVCARSAAFRPSKPNPKLAGSSCARACGARKDRFQDALTARLPSPHRAKTGLVGDPDFAALDSLRSSRAERSSQALTLVSWAKLWKDTVANPAVSVKSAERMVYPDFERL